MKKINFSRQLIKGKITELIFEQMFRDSGKFTILRGGYEYTLPEIAQYQHSLQANQVLENIRNSPDFILISEDKQNVFLVEVKFRTKVLKSNVLEIAIRLVDRWHSPWLFVATPEGFYFEPCNSIIKNSGQLNSLSKNWVSLKTQISYLSLLNEFVKRSK